MQTAAMIKSEKRLAQGKRDLEEAIAILSAVLDKDADFHPARLQRGEARFALDDLIGAKADYQYVRDRDAEAKEVLLKEAALNRLVYVRGGKEANLVSADALLERALEIDPNYFDALFERGNVWHLRYDSPSGTPGDRRHAFNKALVWYRRAMALNPRAREPRVEWARICMKAAREGVGAGNLKAAHDLIERVESEAGDVAVVHKERARLNLHPEFSKQTGIDPTRRFQGAEKALELLAEQSPGDPDLPELRSLFHRTRGYSFYWTWVKERLPKRKERARQLAVEEWTRALDAWPDDPENESVRSRLGEIAPQVMAERYHRCGVDAYGARRFQDAVDAFSKALALFPEATELRLNYAQALLRSGRIDEALAEFERVANGPDGERFPQAMYEAGNICLVRREKSTARVWFERYLATVEKRGEATGPLVERARRMVAELK
jgi:tetratricopeptide (TPR) repeat protein